MNEYKRGNKFTHIEIANLIMWVIRGQCGSNKEVGEIMGVERRTVGSRIASVVEEMGGTPEIEEDRDG